MKEPKNHGVSRKTKRRRDATLELFQWQVFKLKAQVKKLAPEEKIPYYAILTFLKFCLNLMDIKTFSEQLARRVDLYIKTSPQIKISDLGEALGAPKNSSGANKREYYSRLLRNLRQGKVHLKELEIVAKLLKVSWRTLLYGEANTSMVLNDMSVDQNFANIKNKLDVITEILYCKKFNG